MFNNCSYKYDKKNTSNKIFLVLHGVSKGIESDFINLIYTTITQTNNNAFAINFPYYERGEKEPSENLVEEVNLLKEIIDYLKKEGYTDIIIVAKSLGGIVTNRLLEKYPNESIKVVVLGFVTDSINASCFKNKLKFVFQGEFDRFGNKKVVLDILEKENVNAEVFEIKGGDHSYRNMNESSKENLKLEVADKLKNLILQSKI